MKSYTVVNLLILGIGVLLVGYVIINFIGLGQKVYSAGEGNVGRESFADLGAGTFCSKNTDCGSNRCGVLDDGGKRRCF